MALRICLLGSLLCLLLLALLFCLGIVSNLIPRKLLCATEVSLTELVSNLSSANDIRCHTLGTRLGYGHVELDAMADVIELVERWSDDRLNNGPLFSHGSLYDVLKSEEYGITSHEVIAVHAFEACSELVYNLSSGALYGALVLLVMIGAVMIMCQPFHCSGFTCCTSGMSWDRAVHERRTRVRTESEMSNPESEASGILIKNPIFNENVTVNVTNSSLVGRKGKGARLHFFSCIFSDGERDEIYESAGEDNHKPPKRLFKKDVDGTLTRSNVQLVCEAMQSVGILFAWNAARGTVIRVGSHYIMTAWHVIKDIVIPVHNLFSSCDVNAERLAQDEIYVDFHEYTRRSPDRMLFKLLPKIIFCDKILDIVILELDRTGKEYLPPPMQCFSDVFQLNSGENQIKCVHIIGQHPSQENVVVDFGCKVINKDDKNVKRARKWMKNNMSDLRKTALERNENPNDVDTAYYDVFDTERRLIFNTFLEFGSSGGGVVALLPEGKVALVAVLTHGLPPNYWYSVSSHKFPESMRMEVGCTIKAVTQSMEWKGSEVLRDQLFDQKSDQAVDEDMPMETDQDQSDQDNKAVPMETTCS